jgi:hypothetical protein
MLVKFAETGADRETGHAAANDNDLHDNIYIVMLFYSSLVWLGERYAMDGWMVWERQH